MLHVAERSRAGRAFGRALRVAAVYLAVGLLWIVVSDRLLQVLVTDPALAASIQTAKGWVFVFLSAALMWALVAREIRGIERGERRFRALVEQSLAGVGVAQDGRFVYANPKLARILGLSVRQLLAHPRPEELVTEKQRAAAAELLAGRGGAGAARRRQALRVLAADGKERPIELSFQDMEWGDRPACILVVLDRSGEEALEEQLRHAQRMEEIGRLTGAVAHDFNNLLTAAGAPLELALLELEEGHPARAELDEALRAVRSATLLTRQLLTFSRKRVSRPLPVRLDGALREMEDMVRRLMGERVEVRFELEEPGGSVLIDPAHFEQVLVNLVVNAREAMPGGGTLTVRTRTVASRPELLRHRGGLHPGAHAVVEVVDTGHGMDPDIRNHAFEPYFTTREKGTGLGLSTVFGIVRQAGGFIRVESEPGRGTSMQVHLPLTEGEAAAAGEQAHEETRRLAGTAAQGSAPAGAGAAAAAAAPRGTILVVEDDASVRRVFERVLEREGYGVLGAEDGASALELLERHEDPVDLLVTDVMLPGMSGVALAAEFELRRPGVPVLYVSGYSEEDLTRELRTRPGLAFLEKPFQVEELIGAVRRAVAGRAREGERRA